MTRIRVRVAMLAGSMAVLALVSLLELPAAAADLPLQSGAAGAAGAAGMAADLGTPFMLNLDGVLPGDALAPQTVALPASHQGPYRLRALTSGSDALAWALNVRITTSAGAVLFVGPLASATASGDAPAGGETLTVAIRLDAAAGNDVQGQPVAVRWDLAVADGLD